MKTLWSLINICMLIIFSAGMATAAMCGPREGILKALGERYKESSHGMGLTSNANVVEVFTSDGGKTWTLLISSPDGKTCLIGAGMDWIDIAPVPAGLKS